MTARIDLVEDSEALREALERALQSAGYEVRAFGDAEEAHTAFEAEPPQLLVTDVSLPGKSGLELVETIRATHDRLALPVIVVSARDGLEEVARGYAAGADDYLLKPVPIEFLLLKVEQLLQRSASATPKKPSSGRSSRERYSLGEPLASGGQAMIVRAVRRGDGAAQALKLLAADAPPEAVARLLAEAELLRSLSDVPGVVPLRDVGQVQGRAFFAMDLVPGPTLARRLEGGEQLPRSQAAQIGRSLAETLAALAARGVVHGDVSPGNVILPQSAERVGETVLIDFGLACQVGESAARGGTPAYAAPEVLRGDPVTPAADLYGLGTILFEAIAGTLPYAASGDELAAKKVAGEAPDLSPLLALEAAPGLVAVCEACLAPDPLLRPSDAKEVATALLPYARV